MPTIVINTDDLRGLARTLRGVIDRLDQLEVSVRQRMHSDPALVDPAVQIELQGKLAKLVEFRNVLSRDHNELVREINSVEADEGADPGGSGATHPGGTQWVDPSDGRTAGKVLYDGLIDLIMARWGSGGGIRDGWVDASGSVVPGTEHMPVPGFGSEWDDASAEAFDDELARMRATSGNAGGRRDDGKDETNRGDGTGTGSDGSAGDSEKHGSGPAGKESGRGPGGTGESGGKGANGADGSGEKRGGGTGEGPGASKAEGGPGAKDGAGGPGKNGPGAEGAEGTEGEGEGTGKGEEKGKGGESGGGGGGGGFGGSIGDFFQAILDNPISAILTALPFITNPVGLLGAAALLAVFADDIIAGVKAFMDDPAAFAEAIGDFVTESIGDLIDAAETFVTDPASLVGDTISSLVEGAVDEVEGYLQDLQDDPLGTLLETAAEVAKIAGVDVGSALGDAFAEIAPELASQLDDVVEIVGDAAEAIEDIADVVATTTAAYELIDTGLELLDLDVLPDSIPVIGDAEQWIREQPFGNELIDRLPAGHAASFADLPGVAEATQAGDAAMKELVDSFAPVTEVIEDGYQFAEDTIDKGREMVDAVTGEVQDAYDAVVAPAREAYDAVTGEVQDAYDAVVAPAREAYDAVTGEAQDAYDAVVAPARETYDAVTGEAQDAYDAVTGDARDALADGAQQVADLAEQGQNAVDGAAGAVRDSWSDASDAVDRGREQATQQARSAVEALTPESPRDPEDFR